MSDTGSNGANVWSAVANAAAENIRLAGLSSRPLFDRLGIVPSQDPCAPLPLRTVVQLYEEAAAYTGQADFGLLGGCRITPYDLGPIGLFFISSLTLGQALRGFCDHVSVMQEDSRSELVVDGDIAYFIYKIEAPRIILRRQDAEFSLSATVNLIREIAGSSWQPLEVHFEHRAPQSTQAHQRIFRAPLYFQQPYNMVIFPTSDLNLPCQGFDSRLFPLTEHYLSLLRRKKDEVRSPLKRLERIMEQHYPSGDGDLTTGEAASQLGMSRRSLQRAYQKQGLTFSQSKSQKRQSLAHSYLGQPELAITEIAFMLSYADVACFTRACKRWFGMTPTDYRRKLLNGEIPPLE